MSAVSVQGWKEFRLGDLFDVFNGKKYVTHKRTPGSLPLVSNSTADNGIGDFIADRPDNVWSNFISVAYGSGTGIAFYHKQKAFVGETVMALVPKFNMTPSVGIFIAGVLTRYGADTYKYERKPKVDEYRTEVTIMLPAIPDGSPDWAYMEQYMRQIMDKEETFAQHLASLTDEAAGERHVVDTSSWKAFKVGELFSCETTNSIPSKNNLTDGDISYVTRSAVDNGLTGTCGNHESINAGRCITIGAEGFIAFWQPDDFVAGNKVYALRHDKLNEVNALFVCAALNVLAKEYSFANARVLDSIKAETIMLPSTPDGSPDWAYMEEYMRQIMAREQVFADHLASFA